nr:rhythmically expressed gene 5 protein [Onthophagus taurus]
MLSAKVFLFGIFCAVISSGNSSAIPMWEYLTRDEKVMYLFNMFQIQVQSYCKTDVCKQDLKNFGWKKLKEMSEDGLDEMDPFQRNSNDIIWDTVMEGHKNSINKSTRNEEISTIKPNSFDDYLELDASAKIETVSKVLPPKGFNYNQQPMILVGSGSPEYKLELNRFKNQEKDTFSFGPSSNKIQEATTENVKIFDSYGDYQRIPLQGPWVVKVHPDGTPVKGSSSETVPEDDDLRLYQMTKVAIQSL